MDDSSYERIFFPCLKKVPSEYLIYGVIFAKVIYSRLQKDIYISDSRQNIVSCHLMLAMNLPSM
ncbi:hypothetical protein ACSBR1_042062 [Camellia fascicularis]